MDFSRDGAGDEEGPCRVDVEDAPEYWGWVRCCVTLTGDGGTGDEAPDWVAEFRADLRESAGYTGLGLYVEGVVRCACVVCVGCVQDGFCDDGDDELIS